MVHHLSETSGTHNDSTIYGNEGTCYGTMDQDGDGIIDGADVFDGSDDLIDVGTDSSMNIYGSNNDFSISLWVKRDDLTNMEGFFASGSASTSGIVFCTKFDDQNDIRFLSKDNTVDVSSNSNVLNDYTWHLIGVTADRDGMINLWVDGISVASQNISTSASENWDRTADTYKIGTDRSEGAPYDGVIDEVRTYNGLLSEGWIKTEYNNQYDTSSFYDIGVEETIADEPILANPSPYNGATNVELTPSLSVEVFDVQSAFIAGRHFLHVILETLE